MHEFNNTHEFLQKFPNQRIICENTLQKKKIINLGRKQLKQHIQKRVKSNTGKKRTLEQRQNISNGTKIAMNLPEIREKYLKEYKKWRKNYEVSSETRKKQRIKASERIERLGGGPNYNPKATEFFKNFDISNNISGIYRDKKTNQKEYRIPELGYFTDYINFEEKLIIEYDEKYHNDDPKQREKDIIRQNEIQEFYPDFIFLRFNDEFLKSIKIDYEESLMKYIKNSVK
jgi:very-short-patch-repair endonuclease